MKKLLTLFTLLLTVCSGAWAEESATNNPATVSYGTGDAAKTFLNVANTVSNTTIKTGSIPCVTYGLYELHKNWKPAWSNEISNGSSSSYNYTNAADYGFLAGSNAGSGTPENKSATSGYGATKYTNTTIGVFYVTGITGIAVMGRDKGSKDEKRLYIKVEEYGEDGTLTAVGEGDGITKSSYSTSLHITTFDAGELVGTKYYKVSLYGGDSNNEETSQIRFTKYIAPAGPTISSFSPVSGKNVKTGAEITINGTSGSTIYYAWATSAQTADAIYNSGSGNHGTADAGTATTTVKEGKTLYAIARKDNTNSAVASATYTIDDTAPTLSSSTPANSATGVVLSGNIVLTFSENVSINDASKFTLTGGAGTLNTASATVSGAAVTIPYSGLASGTAYTFSTAAGAVKDEAGNTNAALSDISFTSLADETAPTLSSSSFDGATTGYTSAFNATYTFSENVTLEGSFSISPNSGVTIGTPSVKGAVITVPISGLTYGTNYTITLPAGGVEDAAGNALESAVEKAFSTMATPAVTKIWDFEVALSDNDKTNFTADGTNWTNDYSSNKRFANNTEISTLSVLTANSKTIEKTSGLLFTAAAGRLRVADDYLMYNTNVPMTIPNLKAGDEVIVKFSSGKEGNDRSISVTNATLVWGTTSSSKMTANDATAVFKVTDDGDVAISSANNFMRYYSVKVATNSGNAISVSSAKYATFSSTQILDFTGTGVTAYKATSTGKSSVTLEEVSGVVPAETGLLLKADAGTYYIPLSTADPTANVADNLLQSTATAAHNIAAGEVGRAFVFGKFDNTEVGFFKAAEGKTIGVGKSYLLLDAPLAKDVEFLSFVFGDEEQGETDGIKAVSTKVENGVRYNLAGQKVGADYKGIVIVNGKKVIIK